MAKNKPLKNKTVLVEYRIWAVLKFRAEELNIPTEKLVTDILERYIEAP